MKNALTLLLALILFICTAGFTQQSKIHRKGNVFFQKDKIAPEFKSKNPAFSTQSLTAPYNFSYYTTSYTNLTASTSLNGGITWDDPSYTIPLGFTFIFWNDTITSIELGDFGGWLSPSFSSGLQPFFMYSCDLVDRASIPGDWEGNPGSLSNISYLTSGTPGNRICKIEWNNFGFYDQISEDNVSTDFGNFQVWIYEGSNNIEARFGPSSIVQDSIVYWGSPGPGIGVGLYDYDEDTLRYFGLTGAATAPSTLLVDQDTITVAGDPADGIVYKFSWVFVGVHDFETQNQLLDIYPNPASTSATLVWKTSSLPKNTGIEVIDVLGRIVYGTPASFDSEGRMKLDLGKMDPGSYTLKISSEDKIIYKKLIKQ